MTYGIEGIREWEETFDRDAFIREKKAARKPWLVVCQQCWQGKHRRSRHG